MANKSRIHSGIDSDVTYKIFSDGMFFNGFAQRQQYGIRHYAISRVISQSAIENVMRFIANDYRAKPTESGCEISIMIRVLLTVKWQQLCQQHHWMQ